MNGEQAAFDLEAAETAAEPTFLLGQYRTRMSAVARDHGLERSRQSDPDAYAAALDAIERWAATGEVFDADDIRSDMGGAGGSVVGSAFRSAASRGLIVFAGTTVSTRQTSHGRLQRRWRGAR